MVVLAHLTTLITPDWYEVTKQALKGYIHDDIGVKYALSHIEGDVDLNGLLIASIENRPAFRALLADPRIRTEMMGPATVREVYKALIQPPDRGPRLVGTPSAIPDTVRVHHLIGSDTLSLITRQIVFKRPKTDAELADWMISLDHPNLTAAPIRALMLAMMDTSLSQQDVIERLGWDGYGQEALQGSTSLLTLRVWYLSNPENAN